MSATKTEPETTQERKLADGCERQLCTRDVFADALVPVYVGDVEQKWCPQCVKDEMGLDYAEYQNRQSTFLRFVTGRTVTAFLAGMLVMLMIASIAVV